MQNNTKLIIAGGLAIAIVAVIYISDLFGGHNKIDMKLPTANAAENTSNAPSGKRAGDPLSASNVELNDTQVKSIEVGSAVTHDFSQQRTAVGSIDFNENLSVQVFSPYQGKILKAYAEIGDDVVKGKTLFTIESPDLIQAESTLIAAPGVYSLTTNALARAKQLFEIQGIAQKDMEQAVSDQQTAEGGLNAARNAVRDFGKSDAEIDGIIASRKIDPLLVVPSPITGRVTARVAQPGLLVQPGNPPAPYSVADMSTVWMLANVTESDSPAFHNGQGVKVKVVAFPDRDFEGKITTIGATVDPNTHTVLIRSELRDPKHELRPGMLATYVIRTGNPITALAMPLDGVVREGDGTMTVWVTTDRRHFSKRTVKIGLQQDNYDQIIDGLQPGELVVNKGAIFLSNMLNGSPKS